MTILIYDAQPYADAQPTSSISPYVQNINFISFGHMSELLDLPVDLLT